MSPYSTLSALALALLLTVCTVWAEETQSLEESNAEAANHQPQKRSAAAMLDPELASDDSMAYSDQELEPYLMADDSDLDKRSSLFRFGKRGGSLFRFGKRGGSLFRFGKRGSIFRFGKRGGLFRFGKRGGTLFRFGKRSDASPVDDAEEEKRTLFRFGKRSDLDLVRAAIENGDYPVYEELRKRAPSGFHWGES